MGQKPWDGRFAEKTDALVEAFTASIDVDSRLYAHDVLGSIAHVKTLKKAGLVTAQEARDLIRGLNTVKAEIERGDLPFDQSLEDIHMHVETRLAELVGDTAHKLHTGRSRNDQVATDVRMYLRDAVRDVLRRLFNLRAVLVKLAGDHAETLMPGYTHMQRAQPVVLAHHFLAYYEMFSRDAARFTEALGRINVMPLGSAALAGTPFPLDRKYTARLLGFTGVSRNSLDAVSDRDFALEFISAASLCMVHLSRMSEELVLWSSSEFGFLTLPDAFATGSSIMPQKKNPDVPELVRGKTGRVAGNLVAMLTLMKSLPLAYNRDMQEDKPPLFDTVDTLLSCLGVVAAMLPRCVFNKEKMEAACSRGYLNATDLADYLVEKGVPFRRAHQMAGKAVAHAISLGKELDEIALWELEIFSGAVGPDVLERLDARASAGRRRTRGGTAPENVRQEISIARKELAENGKAIE